MPKKPIIMCWSGGKDSAITLGRLLDSDEWAVEGLFTTITETYDRVSMHGVRRELLKAQAEAIGLPLKEVMIPPTCVNDTYQARMREACLTYKTEGIHHMAFGDLFLEDIRNYRDEQLAKVEMQAVYPLWQENTLQLAHECIGSG